MSQRQRPSSAATNRSSPQQPATSSAYVQMRSREPKFGIGGSNPPLQIRVSKPSAAAAAAATADGWTANSMIASKPAPVRGLAQSASLSQLKLSVPTAGASAAPSVAPSPSSASGTSLSISPAHSMISASGGGGGSLLSLSSARTGTPLTMTPTAMSALVSARPATPDLTTRSSVAAVAAVTSARTPTSSRPGTASLSRPGTAASALSVATPLAGDSRRTTPRIAAPPPTTTAAAAAAVAAATTDGKTTIAAPSAMAQRFGLFHSALLPEDTPLPTENAPVPAATPTAAPASFAGPPVFNGEAGRNWDDAPALDALHAAAGESASVVGAGLDIGEYIRLQNRRALQSDKTLAALRASIWAFLIECTDRCRWPIPHDWLRAGSVATTNAAATTRSAQQPFSPTSTLTSPTAYRSSHAATATPPPSLPLYVMWSVLRQHLRLQFTKDADRLNLMSIHTGDDELELKAARAEREQAVNDARDSKRAVEEVKARCTRLEHELGAADEERRRLEHELEQKTSDLEQSTSQYERLVSDKSNLIASLQSTLAAREAEARERQLKNNEFITTIERQLSTTAQAMNAQSASHAEFVALKSTIAQLTNALSVAEKQLLDREREQKQLKVTVAQMNSYKKDVNRARTLAHDTTVIEQQEVILKQQQRIQQLEWLITNQNRHQQLQAQAATAAAAAAAAGAVPIASTPGSVRPKSAKKSPNHHSQFAPPQLTISTTPASHADGRAAE